MKFWIFLSLLFCLSPLRAEDVRKIDVPDEKNQTILFGHNMAFHSDVLDPGKFTFGTYAAGAGIFKNWMIVTSPWLIQQYEMVNILSRGKIDLTESRRIGIQAGYFNTGLRNHIDYQMEAVSLWFHHRWKVNDTFGYSLGWNWMRFFEEAHPFSLRRQPFNDDPNQHTITQLFEFKATERFGAFLEANLLGINFRYPNYQFGISLHYRFDQWLFQFGFSAIGQISSLFEDENWAFNDDPSGSRTLSNREIYRREVTLHPEIQLQFFF